MLTCTDEFYRGRFGFRVFGNTKNKTIVFKFLDKELRSSLLRKKLLGVLKAINSDPKNYSHDEKFKRLEGDVWEIKIKQHRIACIWDSKPHNLIAIYGFVKKQDKWPKRHLESMRGQKSLYLKRRQKRIEGDYYGRTKQIQE